MIHDLVGTYCPMGCGQTLHLMPGGLVACLSKRCPDPAAARKILSDPEHRDVVVFGEDSFTVLHPLRERLGDLFACQIHNACTRLDGPPEGQTGRYRAWFGDDGDLVLEAAPEPSSL